MPVIQFTNILSCDLDISSPAIEKRGFDSDDYALNNAVIKLKSCNNVYKKN